MTEGSRLQAYYARRAAEYEAIYRRDDPVRQQEQQQLAGAMCRWLAGRRVIELACGTGYWTERLAESARSIHATDASPEVLALARTKAYPSGRVSFAVADAWRRHHVAGAFDAALANFWFSHLPRSRASAFLASLRERLRPGSMVFMADNVYIEGVGGELVRREGTEDTWKVRRLADGSIHEVLKNYYTAEELRSIFGAAGEVVELTMGRCFWWVAYAIRDP